MIIRRKHHVPGLNTTSTADISFMLLIFFLVTTSMDVDKGLLRQLPPPRPQEEQRETDVSRENMLKIELTSDNHLLVNDRPEQVSNLRRRVTALVESRGPRHLITLRSEREASYDLYFHVQNELMAAYRLLRERQAERRFGRAYASLSATQRSAVDRDVPHRISESYATAEADKAGTSATTKGARP